MTPRLSDAPAPREPAKPDDGTKPVRRKAGTAKISGAQTAAPSWPAQPGVPPPENR